MATRGNGPAPSKSTTPTAARKPPEMVSAPVAQPRAATDSLMPAGGSRPELSLRELDVIGVGTSVESGPTLQPPSLAGDVATAVGAVTATWQYNKTVVATWSINEPRNAFMSVQGLGWRKLYNASDGAFVSLVFLATQARQTGRPISFREEPDGMVHEIYLW